MFTSKQTCFNKQCSEKYIHVYSKFALLKRERKVGSPCLKATTAGKAWYWQWGKWPSCTEYYMWHRQGQWWLLCWFYGWRR